MEVLNDGTDTAEVLPGPYSARNIMYEYGSTPYAPIGHGLLMFSEQSDGAVYVLQVPHIGVAGDVKRITGKATLRYSDFYGHPASPWVISIEEDHENDTPSEVKNYIVAVNYETGVVKRVVAGADFYYVPQFSSDGLKMCWLQWNHPDLPFGDAVLYVADVFISEDGDIRVNNVLSVTGGRGQGVAEPRWGRDDTLYFAKEINEFRRPFRLPPDESMYEQICLKPALDAEFGDIGLSPCR
jgi:hypothetical protein